MAFRSFFHLRILSAPVDKFVRRILIALLIAIILLAGIQLRRWIGDTTRHVRYQHDLVNGFYWGSEVLKQARRISPDQASANSWTGFCRGYFALYDRVKDKAYEKEYALDYPPLRLLVMAIWAKQVRDGFPWVSDDHPKLVNPLLKINFICELVSALAIFLLVRECLRRSRPTQSSLLNRLPQQHRGWICGLAAASAAWLEPSMILDAHGWPQWDVWILPFYLFAAFAALIGMFSSQAVLKLKEVAEVLLSKPLAGANAQPQGIANPSTTITPNRPPAPPAGGNPPGQQ